MSTIGPAFVDVDPNDRTVATAARLREQPENDDEEDEDDNEDPDDEEDDGNSDGYSE
jgi:hypothetical protein